MTIGVNGNDYDWGSITFKTGNQIFDAFTKISYGDKRTRTKGYGAGKHRAPTHRGRGKYEIDPVKVTGYTYELQAFRAALAAEASDGVSYGNVEFEIIVQYEENGVLHQVEIERCVWFEDAAAHDESSTDPLTEEVSFDPMRLSRDGLTLFDSSEGAPQ